MLASSPGVPIGLRNIWVPRPGDEAGEWGTGALTMLTTFLSSIQQYGGINNKVKFNTSLAADEVNPKV